ncbi:MAG: PocR ligand-binding domain-containing protein [Atribacterota bacterium]
MKIRRGCTISQGKTNSKSDFFGLVRIVGSSNLLQELLDAFCKTTGLYTAIQSIDGELIMPAPPENFCLFCRRMFFSPEGHTRCMKSGIEGALKAFQAGSPFIYHCHAGLVDIAVPIVVEGLHIGSVVCGQILLKSPDERYRARVRKCLALFPETFIEEQVQALDKVPILDLPKVKAIARLLHAIADKVVNLVVQSIREKERNARNVQKIDEMKAMLLLEKRIKNAEIRLKETELKALEAQINPHFLYNALDSIQWLATLHGAKDIQKVVYALGKLLRYSLDRKGGIVTLREELEHVENYLLIQKIRYGDKISYVINVQPTILSFPFPKFVLQPLVENAIEHGIEPKGVSGTITISGWLEEESKAVLEISDNGIGMSDALQRSLMIKKECEEEELISRDHTTQRRRIGLVNIQKRMAYYYGSKYQFAIESIKNVGTTIRLCIPFALRRGGWIDG